MDGGPRRRAAPERCATCGRFAQLTFHHLIPRKMHRRNYFRRRYAREALQAGIYVCRPCHRGIHRSYDEMTLGRRFSTLQSLLEDESLARHFAWVSKQRRG